MLFKNATVVRLTGDIPRENEELLKVLESNRFVPAREMESERRGWIPPSGKESDDLVYAQGAVYLLCLQIESKILPASVIREELKERMALREAGGRKIRSKEKQQLMDEIRFDLLPRAFSKFTRVLGYIDYQRQEVVVGTASKTQVDEFLAFLRASLGSLPVQSLKAEYSPTMRMTDWARLRQAPSKVKFGAEITLVEPEGGKGSFRKQDLLSDEIQQCIEAGKQVQRMAFEWNDYLSFTIDEELTIRKLSALDMFDQEYEGDSDEDDDIAANLFLTFMALRELLPELYKWFGVGEPEYANGEDGDGSEEVAGFDVDDFNDRDSGDFDHDRMNEEFDEQEDASAPEDAVTEGYD
jgi:recombination associated protein RdgC